jgi:hypothetical protein
VIFEKILEQQLSDFFENICNPYLCAFRRGHGCQTTMLRLLEDWRNALEKISHLLILNGHFYWINVTKTSVTC